MKNECDNEFIRFAERVDHRSMAMLVVHRSGTNDRLLALYLNFLATSRRVDVIESHRSMSVKDVIRRRTLKIWSDDFK